MKINTNPLSPAVANAKMTMITNHFQSPLNIGGKQLKKNTVQENPTGASRN
jgi:hypothetical protein